MMTPISSISRMVHEQDGTTTPSFSVPADVPLRLRPLDREPPASMGRSCRLPGGTPPLRIEAAVGPHRVAVLTERTPSPPPPETTAFAPARRPVVMVERAA